MISILSTFCIVSSIYFSQTPARITGFHFASSYPVTTSALRRKPVQAGPPAQQPKPATRKRRPRLKRTSAVKSNLAFRNGFGSRALNTRPAFSDLKESIASLGESEDDREHWNYQKAYLYWLQQRAYPRADVNWNAYGRAFAQRSRMFGVTFARPGFAPQSRSPQQFKRDLTARQDLSAASAPQWRFVGPRNLPIPYQQYYGEGMVSGRVNGVAFDPHNSNIMYVASAGGGFWRSSDGGKAWICLSDRWENVKFSIVAVHPTNSNIIIVGTGDFAGGLGYGYGLMMTTDGGAHWSNLLRTELRWYCVSQVIFDPDDPRIIIVTAGRHPQNKGVAYRSADGGQTWSRILAAARDSIDWNNIQISAKEAQGQRYYYAVGATSGNFLLRTPRTEPGECSPGELWRSSNRGVTWTRLAGPLAGNCIQMIDVAPSPTTPQRIYAIIRDFSSKQGSVWASDNAGDSWHNTTNNFPHHYNVQEQDNYNWSQAGYDFYIKCTKHTTTGQDVIYVGLIDLVASTDSGSTWQSVGRTYMRDARTHNDQHALAINPRNPNDLLVGNDGGVYRLTYDPAAQSWTFQSDMNAGLGMTMFYRIAIDPANPDWIMGGTQDNATPVSMGDLASWSNKGEGDGGFCAINPQDPNIQYATSQDLAIYQTNDRWSSRLEITPTEKVMSKGQMVDRNWGNDNRGFIGPIALSPTDPRKLYAGTNYLWCWDGQTWNKRLGDKVLASGDGYVNFVAVAPTDGNRIYTGSSVGDLWMTTDGGTTWQRIDNDRLPGATPALPVTSIAIHPTNPDSILVGFGSTEGFAHLWSCKNTRASDIRWTPIAGAGTASLPSIPLNAVAIDQRHPESTYYVGTDVGVFLSNDGGATWANFGTPLGLPNVQITDLQFVPGKRQLVAATFGRGAWRIDLPEGVEPLYFKQSLINGANFGRARRMRSR